MVKRTSKSKPGAPKPKAGIEMPELPRELVEQLLESLSKGGSMPWGQVSAVDELESAFQDFLDLDDPEERDESGDEVLSVCRTAWIRFGSMRTAGTHGRARP